MTLMGPHMIGSNSLSVLTMASIGSLKTQRGSAKFIVTFLYASAFLPIRYFMISIPTAPTTIAVVVAMAGMILPAISLILKLSASSI